METLINLVDAAIFWSLTVVFGSLVAVLALIAGVLIVYFFVEAFRAIWFFLLVAVFVCLIPVEIMLFLYRVALDVVCTACGLPPRYYPAPECRPESIEPGRSPRAAP